MATPTDPEDNNPDGSGDSSNGKNEGGKDTDIPTTGGEEPGTSDEIGDPNGDTTNITTPANATDGNYLPEGDDSESEGSGNGNPSRNPEEGDRDKEND
eukprot:CAMPEP_0170553086 /NCGR_PEP_ID=MMETSP0211-20121228/10935_1 /TAXON_ID=311385 /ORGANISM="Pseudokeronopsis sp., Strain OXSARD2" /LENGTH=97 /DNA_ID=CAMNT_0010861215 /DNA_START=470 /DNA_END=762 /DNA_ORIENTATION=+